MTVEYVGTRDVPLADLTPYPGNARRGDTEAIRASLRRNGQYRALVVRDTGDRLVVLAGNHTLAALDAEYRTTARCEVIRCDDDTAVRVNLADNRVAELGTYDNDALAALVDLLDGDLAGTGWTDEALDALLAPPTDLDDDPDGDDDRDNTPAPPAEPVAALGDLWLLGRHRLFCGDATDPATLDRLTDTLPAGQPGIVYTDPPYGIAVVGGDGKVGDAKGQALGGKGRSSNIQGAGTVVRTHQYRPVANDDTPQTAADAFALLRATYPDAVHVWWGANHYAATAGIPNASRWLIWDKETNGDFADAELAWTNHPGSVRLLRHKWNGMLRDSEHGVRLHPTQKPVALAAWAFRVVDPRQEHDVVLDVFAGSGSTLLAAHDTDRVALLAELEPAYVDVICRRYQQYTGDRPARLDAAGRRHPHDFTTD